MRQVSETYDIPVAANQTLTALRLNCEPLPGDTPYSWLVGVGCHRCGTIYALEVPVQQNVHALLAAVEWVGANMGFCGAHPELLIQSEAKDGA